MSEFLNLDTVRYVATPEGCEISLRLSGPIIRAWAWTLDFLIRFVVWIGIINILGRLGDFGVGMILVSAFLLEWLYPVLFEVLWNGKTPGKNICGLVVMHDDGTPVNWHASFVRNTLRFVDFAPVLYATGFVTMMLNRDGKRLGDLVAGTVVAYLEKEQREFVAKNQGGAEPPPFALTPDEQRAMIEFRNRARTLTAERAGELAVTAEPLAGDLTPDHATSRLIRIANYLLGDRQNPGETKQT